MPNDLPLNNNEQAVFYHIIKHPSLNDREIGERTRIKTSTVTAIRKRLASRGMYSTIRVPNFRMLGFELMVIGYGPLPLNEKSTDAMRACSETFVGVPEVFYAAHSKEASFFIAAAKNYTSAKRFIDNLLKALSESTNVDEWSFVFMPFELSAILNFFDCTSIMERLFKMPHGMKESQFFDTKEIITITHREGTVLKRLVEHPHLPDVSIAKMSNVSRQSVAGMRRKFEKRGLIKTLKIPNFSSLGFEIMVLAHTVFNPSIHLIERKDGIKYMITTVPQFFLASGNYENIMLAITRNYEEYSFFKGEILKLYQKKDYVKKEPKIYLLPINETKILKNHHYSPLLEKALKKHD